MNKIKVLHIITRLDPGGSSTNTIETVARLNKDKFDVFLISGRTVDPGKAIEEKLKAKNIVYSFFPDLQRELSFFKDWQAFWQLVGFLRKNSFDIVHTHSSKAGILGRWAAKLAGVPYIIHTPHGHVFYGYFGRFKTCVFIWVERLTALITDKIITLTNLGQQEHINFKIAPANKFVTIYSGIDLDVKKTSLNEQIELKKQWNIPQERFVFGCVARLDPIKGISYLLDAFLHVFRKYPQIHLLLVGDGQDFEKLKQQCDQLGLNEQVTFTGFQQEANNFIQIMDVFVLASLNEGMGRVILEAMVLGKPVIATKVGGIPELIKDGDNGLLVNAKDSHSLALSMIRIIEDKQLLKKMALQAQIRTKEQFSLDKMVKDIENLYQQ